MFAGRDLDEATMNPPHKWGSPTRTGHGPFISLGSHDGKLSLANASVPRAGHFQQNKETTRVKCQCTEPQAQPSTLALKYGEIV